MPVESFSYITSLNASNPVHATDQVSEGDDHLRGVKTTLLNSFPQVAGAVTVTHTEFNNLDGVTGVTGTGDLVLHTAPTVSGLLTAGSFAGDIDAADLASGVLADARVQESNVTQHEAALTVTESQVSDLGTYLESGDTAALLTVDALSIENLDTTITRDAAGQIAVEGAAVLTHNDGALVSAKIHISTSAPSGGSDGDIWFEREA